MKVSKDALAKINSGLNVILLSTEAVPLKHNESDFKKMFDEAVMLYCHYIEEDTPEDDAIRQVMSHFAHNRKECKEATKIALSTQTIPETSMITLTIATLGPKKESKNILTSWWQRRVILADDPEYGLRRM